ncbi:glycosyltransferase family 2 protein [Clostridium thermobutyricum]|uniref:glycosyltransferase family 2 protein n=1 Tax=Clostridium thermobutyricum TaxID=29372 RepID=UPI003F528B9F
MKAFISIIIPVFNEEKYIENCIKSLLEMDYDKNFIEIIFVDGNSTDRTKEIIKQFMKKNSFISIIDNPKRIAPVAMNLGIEKAKGNFIMRMDAHSYYPNNYISGLIEWKMKLKADNVGAICETIVVNKNKKSLAISEVLSNKFGVGNGLFRIGVNEPTEVDTVPFGLYDRETLIKLGGYDERLIRNQDIELNERLRKSGGKIYLIHDIKFKYFSRECYKDLMKNNYNNGKWNILTAKYTKTMDTFSIRHFVPMIFILSIILPVILSFINFKVSYISILSILTYLILISTISIKLGIKNKNYIYIFISFLCLHFSYGIGSINGLIESLYKK